MNDLLIFGAGAVGRQIAQIADDINKVSPAWRLVGYLDDAVASISASVGGLTVMGDLTWLRTRPDIHIAVAFGSPSDLQAAYRRLEDMKHDRIATLIHPSVWLPQRAQIGTGTIIYAGTMLDTDITIGRGCIINKGCTIGHDTVLGDYCSLAPGVNLGGRVDIGTGCYFGISSATIQNLTIGSWAIIGAGAVVIDSLPDGVTAVGVPARVIKTRPTAL